MALRIISEREVQAHQQRGDLWIVVHKHVFDVSQWMNSHPGGWEILLDLAKKNEDGGDEFEAIKHSEEARNTAMKYLIGKLEGAGPFPMTVAAKLIPTSNKPVTPTDNNDNGSMMMIAAGIAAVAVGAYFLYKKPKA